MRIAGSTLDRGSIGVCILGLAACVTPTEVGAAPSGAGPAALASYCSGLSDDSRQTGLFERVSVMSVRRISGRVGKAMIPRAFGAEVVIHADRGHTAAWLERLARCEVTRRSGAENNPLGVSGVEVTVRRAGPAFVMRVTAQRRLSAEEIYRRAQQLMRPSATL